MSATLEFLSAHEAGVVLPTIAFLIQQMKDGETEDALSLPPPPPPTQTLTPQPPAREKSPSPDAPPTTVTSSSSGVPRRLSADAMLEVKAPTTTRMAIGGLPPPSPYAPLQRARQHHQRTHEDPNGGGGGGYTRTVSNSSSRQYDEDGTLSATTTYVDRWFEKLFFRNPLVVGGGVGAAGGGTTSGAGGRPPSASRIDERLGKSSSHRSSSSAARRLRCELFAERAAGVLRNNSSRPASGLASVNSSSASGMPPRDPSGGDYSTQQHQYHVGSHNKCAYGDALDDYAAVSPVRRVFQGNVSRPSSGLPSSIGGQQQQQRSGGNKDQTRVRSRVDDAIAAAHRIRSGSARNSRPSSRCARTDDC